MIAEIKQPTKKKALPNPSGVKARATTFFDGSMKVYTTLALLFLVVASLLFSLSNQLPFFKELAASGLILCYVFVMQLNERRVKKMPEHPYRHHNLN